MSYYDDIEFLPLTIWEKCQNGELFHLRKELESGTDEQDIEVWQDLNYQYAEEFGLSRHHQKYLLLKKQLMILELRMLETGNRMLLNDIRMVKSEITELSKGNESQDSVSIDDSLIWLSKFMGFFLNKNDLMTKQYYLLVKQYGKANQKV